MSTTLDLQLMRGGQTDIIVQLNTKTSEAKFIHLKTILTALATEPDLAGIPIHLRAQALQSLYVCTGYDTRDSL